MLREAAENPCSQATLQLARCQPRQLDAALQHAAIGRACRDRLGEADAHDDSRAHGLDFGLRIGHREQPGLELQH